MARSVPVKLARQNLLLSQLHRPEQLLAAHPHASASNIGRCGDSAHDSSSARSLEVATALTVGGVLGAGAAARASRRSKHIARPPRCVARLSEPSGASGPAQVSEFIEEVGVGSYQYQQVLLLACFFFSEASELDVISPLTTAWRLEWALVTDQVALLASIGYVGFAIGTFSSGVLGDSIGRRMPILLGYVGVLVGAIGMWSAASPLDVGVFRAVTGFSVGIGVPASLTIISEIAPSRSRASLVGLCYVAIALGALYADLGLYFFLPDLKSGDWRSLCLFSALPALLALPSAIFNLEDTPAFFWLRGDMPGVSRVLTKMAECNARPAAAQRLPLQTAGTSDRRPNNGDEADWGIGLRRYALPLVGCAALDFTYNFVGFGCGYIFPLMFAELAEGAPILPVGELVLANLLSFPALFLAYKALDSGMVYSQILMGAGLLQTSAVVCLLNDQISFLPVVGIFALKLSMTTFSQTTNTLKGDIFPSVFRVSALSVSGTCGRVGALIAPAIIEETRGLTGSPGEFSTFLSVMAGVLVFATSLGVSLVPERKKEALNG